MRGRRSLPLIATLSFLLGTAAHGATITLVGSETEGKSVVLIEGQIVESDPAEFEAITAGRGQVVVVLNSSGGLIAPATQIGMHINAAGYETVVPGGYSCTSACALIWVAGSRRRLSASGVVGFHAAYRNDLGKVEESGSGNAIVGRYLTQLGLPLESVIFATSAPPERLWLLTKENSEAAGIAFEDFALDWHSAGGSAVDLALPPPPIQIRQGTSSAEHSDEEWLELVPVRSVTNPNGASEIYIVLSPPSRSGNLTIAETITWFNGEPSGLTEIKAEEMHDCSQRQYRVVSSSFVFGEDNVVGNGSGSEWLSVDSGSPSEAKHDFICRGEEP